MSMLWAYTLARELVALLVSPGHRLHGRREGERAEREGAGIFSPPPRESAGGGRWWR
jgi:hypothetical protein